MNDSDITTTEQRRLMLVDDDPNLVVLVSDYLEFRGYEVVTAENGKKALELLEHEIPDLIICDIMMPEMDGYTLVKLIRENRRLSWIPVLFLSAKGQSQDKVKGLNTGADVYIVKPFEPEELIAQVESSLRQATRLIGHRKPAIQTTQKLRVRENVELTPTELRVVQLVARGLGNREISKMMKVSQRTVESHVSNMLGKTGLHNRTELARWALESQEF
ncbi:response regulator transcription factor [Lyngbya sp. CCY1209]|uniref:response regulator transcription factor n=1 Tax=Lyngbya sp. CCY1209 TaxID=2886103 RepID=UPI002D215F14|nr:response regulator transcription factor [Lyngbya sp. CCY1209]MEB3883469.1 response regulator transcription factor [Lyngbya sp. CCY1209]